MSMESYELGDKNNDLFLKMKVGTAGIAVSEVYCLNGNTPLLISKSDKNSGNIKEIKFGKANEFKNKKLHFSSTINLLYLDPANWDQAAKTLDIRIEIKGGKDGLKKFNLSSNDLKIIKKSRILFNKEIHLL